MPRVLVTERISTGGLERFADAGVEVDERLDLTPDELREAVQGAHALVIRSATQVTAEVLSAGQELVVVGRAGIGLDNVDVADATKRGIMVVNAPMSNAISAAEHTMGLLLAQARNVPQAHAALVDGRWERSQWMGVELADKTMGIVGLGRIGKLVAQRAQSFGLKIVAFDPYVSVENARRHGVEMVQLDELARRSDFITLHLAKTVETLGLIDAEFLAGCKPNARIINVARGGIVVEADLAEAVKNGTIAGAALDVFDEEPSTDSPVLGVPGIVVTPHLGASTKEAQEKAGDTIAEQVLLALRGEFVPFAVNVSAAEAVEIVRPFLPLCDRLGQLFASLVETVPSSIEIEFAGEIGAHDNQLASLSVVKGFLGAMADEPVSFVNAMNVADERGIEIRTVTTTQPRRDYINTVTVTGADHSIGGALLGVKSEMRIVELEGHSIDVPPAPHMLVVRNADRPGVIGVVGNFLGEAGVNINDMDVGQSPEGAALMVVTTDRELSASLLDKVKRHESVQSVSVLRGGG